MKITEVKTFIDLLKYIFQKKEWTIIERAAMHNMDDDDKPYQYPYGVRYTLQNQYGDIKYFISKN